MQSQARNVFGKRTCLLSCQRPLTQKRTLFLPSFANSHPCQKANTFTFRTHSLLGPCRTSLLSLANAHTRTLPLLPIHAMLPSIVRRVDRGHVLLSDGWVARAPAPISAACDLSVTACGTTNSTTRPSRLSKTPRAAASASPSSKRPRCATPLPGVPTPDSPATPDSPTTHAPPPRPRLRPATQHVPRPLPRPPPCPSHRLSSACPPRALLPLAPRPPPRPRSRASRGGAPRSAGARS